MSANDQVAGFMAFQWSVIYSDAMPREVSVLCEKAAKELISRNTVLKNGDCGGKKYWINNKIF